MTNCGTTQNKRIQLHNFWANFSLDLKLCNKLTEQLTWSKFTRKPFLKSWPRTFICNLLSTDQLPFLFYKMWMSQKWSELKSFAFYSCLPCLESISFYYKIQIQISRQALIHLEKFCMIVPLDYSPHCWVNSLPRTSGISLSGTDWN